MRASVAAEGVDIVEGCIRLDCRSDVGDGVEFLSIGRFYIGYVMNQYIHLTHHGV